MPACVRWWVCEHAALLGMLSHAAAFMCCLCMFAFAGAECGSGHGVGDARQPEGGGDLELTVSWQLAVGCSTV